ncbi:hypothetical protein BGZ63DRAFT_451634 [Mariannaea sp. PMI_226]|nr:hypothetical protein BGZ63DRAFT_451634 [Mariannaea sp. PMI_226]
MKASIMLTALLAGFATAAPAVIARLEQRQDRFQCTFTIPVGGDEDEGPPEQVTTTINSREACVSACNGLDLGGCNDKDPLDRPGCRAACTEKCATDCLK